MSAAGVTSRRLRGDGAGWLTGVKRLWNWIPHQIDREPRVAKWRRRRLFQTTKTEDRVMAAAASRGLSRPSAASGMARML